MKKIYIFLILLSVTFLGCEKFLDITPKGRVIPQSTQDFRELLNGGYSAFFSYKGLVSFRSDEIAINENSEAINQYKSAYTWEIEEPITETKPYAYIELYKSIFYANEILTNGAKKMPKSEQKNQILAEAYALRAYAHFTLVNLYAKSYNSSTSVYDKGVPLVLSVDLEQEFPKATVQEVYDQILIDINKAKELMNIQKQSVQLGYRFSMVSLNAFESRVYLYIKDYQKSIQAAQRALDIHHSLVDLNQNNQLPSVYNSEESLLSLDDNFTTEEQRLAYASESLLNLYNQENDLRFGLYFTLNDGKYRPNKGGNNSYKVSFRVAELYLNQAEAFAQLGNRKQSEKALFELAKNRYKTQFFEVFKQNVEQLSEMDFKQEIIRERTRELAFEGHRWFDLRRGNQSEIIHTLSGKTYTLKQGDPRYVIPFPKEAVLNNAKLQ